MRPFGFALISLLPAGPLFAGELPRAAEISPDIAPTQAEFRLGGSAASSGLRVTMPATTDISSQSLRLSVPRMVRETSETVQETPIGGLRFYFGEAWTEGDDVFQLGTDLTRGQTTAGMSVTYEDDTEALTSSELYIDYALTTQISVGISGSISDSSNVTSEPLTQMGFNAEIATGNGTYVRGGVANGGGAPPVFGVAIGLRF